MIFNYFASFIEKLDSAWEKLSYNAKVNVIWVAIWGIGSIAAGMLMVLFRSMGLRTLERISFSIPTTLFGLYLIFSRYAFLHGQLTDKREKVAYGICFILLVPFIFFLRWLHIF